MVYRHLLAFAIHNARNTCVFCGTFWREPWAAGISLKNVSAQASCMKTYHNCQGLMVAHRFDIHDTTVNTTLYYSVQSILYYTTPTSHNTNGALRVRSPSSGQQPFLCSEAFPCPRSLSSHGRCSPPRLPSCPRASRPCVSAQRILPPPSPPSPPSLHPSYFSYFSSFSSSLRPFVPSSPVLLLLIAMLRECAATSRNVTHCL